MAERVTLGQLIRDAMDHRLAEVHTSIPGTVDSYDADAQTCNVVLGFLHEVPDGEGGYATEKYPVLQNVPVAFMRGGGFFVSFPLAKGDHGWVSFAERDLNSYRDKGQQTDPADRDMHGLSGAVFFPAVYPDGKKLADAHASNMVIGRDGSSAVIHLKTNGEVHLGAENGAEFVALANLVKARIDALQVAHDTHKHATAAPGTPSIPDVIVGSLAAVAATKVKAT